MFSMKLIKCVVSLMYDSCFLAIGCKSESTKLDIRSVGPPLPETIGLPTGTGLCIFGQRLEFRYSRRLLALVYPLVSHSINVFLFEKCVDNSFV